MIRSTRVWLLLAGLSLLPLHLAAAQGRQWRAGELAQWSAEHDCRTQLNDDVLTIESTGADPYLLAEVASDAGWQCLSWEAKFRGKLDGQVFWSESEEGGFSEQRAVAFSVRARNAQWAKYQVYFKSDSPITQLRWDPAHRKGRIEIRQVSLTNEAPPEPEATPVDSISVQEGFQVELLYSVPGAEQGSWVAMTVNNQGRLIVSDQYGKLYRVVPPPIGSQDPVQVETINVDLGMAQGLLYAFNSLYVSVNGKGSGFYRVKDTDGDDQFDEVKLLRAYQGGGEHGPHAVLLGPDGKSLYVCGGNHTDLPNPETSRAPWNWQEDQLLPRMWDARGHAQGKLAPGGWICKTDPNGEKFELIASGFRNEYDIAFNPEGELFTYDADMEWDVGTPWYRPTRVNHASSGAEFGWRSGTGKWPVWYPDSLPSAVDIGPGSPTGITFGTGAKFPAKYQRSLFISDWSYGIIYAVHLTPDGSTYQGQAERFCAAQPLPVTDMVVHPLDGSLYFTIGGRRTQSGLYRVTYVGSESTAPAGLQSEGEDLRNLRHGLEKLHGKKDVANVKQAWPHLSHEDRYIRFAARIALENAPVASWTDKALAEGDAVKRITALIALARTAPPEIHDRAINSLLEVDWTTLPIDEQLAYCRALSLVMIRLGQPSEQQREAMIAKIDAQFPADDVRLNRELCLLLSYLEAPGVVQRTLALLDQAPTQEEQIHYVYCLRPVKTGWTLPLRQQYFQWFQKINAMHQGGASFGGFIRNIRDEAIANLTESEKNELADYLKDIPVPEQPAAPARPFVKKWTIEELLPIVASNPGRRNLEHGKALFAESQCFKCHRFRGEGGISGPDLTSIAGRFNDRSMLESLIEPSKVVSDQYQSTQFSLVNGKVVSGRVVNLNGDNLMVMTDMLKPGDLTTVKRGDVNVMMPSKLSMMPEGLLNTLTEEDILDLLAYLKAGTSATAGVKP